MKRRRVLALLGVSTTFTAGCMRESGSISITVQNFTSESARIELRLATGETERYTDIVVISGDGKRHLENVVDGGEYTLTVSTDRFGETSRPISMNGCKEQEVSVAILPSEELDVQLKRC